MTKWGFDEPNGIIVGDTKIKAQVFYDNRPQKQEYYSKNEIEAIKEGKNIIKKLKKEFSGYPCYLYQDDNSKWEIRIYN